MSVMITVEPRVEYNGATCYSCYTSQLQSLSCFQAFCHCKLKKNNLSTNMKKINWNWTNLKNQNWIWTQT